MPRKKQTTTTSRNKRTTNCGKTKKRTGVNPLPFPKNINPSSITIDESKLPKGVTLAQYLVLAQQIINMLFGLSKNSAVNQELSFNLKGK